MRKLNLALLSLSLFASPLAPSALAAPAETLEVTDKAKEKMVVLTDGKGHYVSVIPWGREDDRLFYAGDGKKFYSVPIVGGGSEQGKRFNIVFVDPRYYIQFNWRTDLTFLEGKYTLSCGPRKVSLDPVDPAKAKDMIAAASFAPSPRKYRAYALARDTRGVYYYVDRGARPGTEKQFRLFVGPKGGLKPQKMTNVVSDSEGDIFSTKTGSLRLILSKNESSWLQNEKPTKLTIVPVEDNAAMIYTELGVYTGERLGTPCDDL